jgi:hypothetical protein
VAIQLTAFDPARHGFAFANSFTTTVFPTMRVPLLGTFEPLSVGASAREWQRRRWTTFSVAR